MVAVTLIASLITVVAKVNKRLGEVPDPVHKPLLNW